jgi:hypothetical protein
LKRALAIRHLAFEDLGTVAGVLEARGYQTIYLDAGVADLSRVELAENDLLAILGGPIGAYEEATYPVLRQEMLLIERALKRRSRVLGICLGAQLLALTLGARVYAAGRKSASGRSPSHRTDMMAASAGWRPIRASCIGMAIRSTCPPAPLVWRRPRSRPIKLLLTAEERSLSNSTSKPSRRASNAGSSGTVASLRAPASTSRG